MNNSQTITGYFSLTLILLTSNETIQTSPIYFRIPVKLPSLPDLHEINFVQRTYSGKGNIFQPITSKFYFERGRKLIKSAVYDCEK